MHIWILLHYKIPTEPTARRVYIWRKLKRLGAILLYDAVWVLPSNPRTQEHFQWLAAEIVELGGNALLWEARLMSEPQEEQLVKQFLAEVDSEYAGILAALREPDVQPELRGEMAGEQERRAEPDLAALSRRYQQVKLEDYFQSALGRQVRDALMSARENASYVASRARAIPGAGDAEGAGDAKEALES
ncbi:MAG: Chromate resistance protein ChrB [Chloroflexia bacterium]